MWKQKVDELRTARARRRAYDATVPVLKGLPLVGSIAAWRSDAFGVVRAATALGDLARIDVLHESIHVVKHPDAFAALFEEPEVWRRTEGLAPLMGRNVLTTNGAEWRTMREHARPSFHPKMLERAGVSFVRDAGAALEPWRQHAVGRSVFDLSNAAMRVFALATLRSFGLELTASEADRYGRTVAELQHWAFLAISGGSPRTPAVVAAIDALDDIIRRAVAESPATSGPPSYLERLRQDGAVSAQSLRDQLLLVLIAAADNPPNMFAFVVWLLARHSAWERSVTDEIEAVLGGEAPTPAALDRMPTLERVVLETLRLYPGAWIVMREAVRDTHLLGRRMPAGTRALGAIYFLHRHQAFWDRAEVYDPDRFLPSAVEARHRHAYVPFGSGERVCIGSRLALMQIKLLLVMFLQRFRARAESDSLPLEGTFALRARGGVRVRLELRDGIR